MKKITEDWFESARSDLMLIQEIIGQEYLSHLSAFHSQQAIEKSFKAIIEEFDLCFIKTQSLETLHSKVKTILKAPLETDKLIILDQLYIDARYPGELGLLAHGKPTKEESELFFALARKVFEIARKVCNP